MTIRNLKFLAAAAGVSAVVAVALPVQVLAWHPEGKITKFVANETAGTQSVDANSASAAVSVKPGDIIRYTITIRNDGKVVNDDGNDLAFVKLTDTPPAGLQAVSGATGTITENIPGVIKPSKSVVKEYRFKVTSTTDGAVLKNRACFTGDSKVKDNPQQGCDDAYIKVKVDKPQTPPEQPQTPKTPETPQQSEQPTEELPAELPSTGPTAILTAIAGMSAASPAAYRWRQSVQAIKNTLK